MTDVRETLTLLLAFPRDLAASRTVETRLRLTAETCRRLTTAGTAMAAWTGLENPEATAVTCSTTAVAAQMPRNFLVERPVVESLFHHKAYASIEAGSAEMRVLGWTEPGTVRVLAVPIRSCGHVSGWLAIGDPPSPDALAAPHERLLVSIAEQAGRALECSEVTHRMSELDAAKATAAALSHDFNNLLTAILGYGKFIAAATKPGEPVWNDADEIVRAAQKASELTQQLLEISRGKRLPAVQAAPDSTRVATMTPPTPGEAPRRVLVVEDERAVRFLVRTILTRNGFEVVEAAGPAEAETWLSANPDAALDLMITDLVMPGASGVEVYSRARTRRPGLPVLYMSGFGDDIIDGTGTGRFVQKPFTADDLIRAVSAALGTHSRTA